MADSVNSSAAISGMRSSRITILLIRCAHCPAPKFWHINGEPANAAVHTHLPQSVACDREVASWRFGIERGPWCGQTFELSGPSARPAEVPARAKG